MGKQQPLMDGGPKVRDTLRCDCETSAASCPRLGPMKDVRRMNVNLTQAKRGFVVEGNETTLQRDTKALGPWLRWIQQQTFASSHQSRKRAAM